LNYIIREMKKSEYPLLSDFLYESIFQRDEKRLIPRSVLKLPTFNVYIENFGNQKDDICLCAEIDNKVVGAVWSRLIHGFGYVDMETPELAIALYKEYRGQGIGKNMMYQMLEKLKERGFKKISLSVQKDNYALRMYQSVGFKITKEKEEEYIMECNF